MNGLQADLSCNRGMGRHTPSLPLPPVFVSHGSPMIALEPGATGAFFGRLGKAVEQHFGAPRAILAISAHTAFRGVPAADALVLAAARHEAIHDFGGFDPRLNALRYDAPGEGSVAQTAVQALKAAGLRAQALPHGGLDHGIWTALMHLRPQADWPVVPLAWSMQASPQALTRLGEALAPLAADGVWILATGSITHNLARVFGAGGGRGAPDEGAPEIPESRAFRHWWSEHAGSADLAALQDWANRAPHGRDMHPSDEHLLPWFVASGAARGGRGLRLHEGVTFGCLGMDAYAFGEGASALQAGLPEAPQA